MSGHTPGPWTVRYKPLRYKDDQLVRAHWQIKGPDKKHSPIARVAFAGNGMGPSMAVRKANATLIAAAPAMYTALQSMVMNYAQTGRVTDQFVQDVARMLMELDQ